MLCMNPLHSLPFQKLRNWGGWGFGRTRGVGDRNAKYAEIGRLGEAPHENEKAKKEYEIRCLVIGEVGDLEKAG